VDFESPPLPFKLMKAQQVTCKLKVTAQKKTGAHSIALQGQNLVTNNVSVVEGETAIISCRVKNNDDSVIQLLNPNRQTIYFRDVRPPVKDRKIKPFCLLLASDDFKVFLQKILQNHRQYGTTTIENLLNELTDKLPGRTLAPHKVCLLVFIRESDHEDRPYPADSSHTRQHTLVSCAPITGCLTEKEINLVIVRIVGVRDGMGGNKLALCWKEKREKR
ncbi:hypothetical protein DNTS_025512, partial [Danionella cerebrum]